ncbi:hypothetical protein I5F71_02820 [Pseudomonas aeruginosa]|nr:hypothetical protein [Pseudomonas aeruginosa]MBG4718180.1 hypothetical protein [Pseudomonas aeruginosa]
MISKNYNRQAVALALVSIALADVSDGTAQAAIKLPGGAVVVGGFLVVDEVFNAATTATAKVGDALDDDRYSASPLDLATLGVKQLTVTGFKTTSPGDVTVKYAFTGAAATTGKARLFVQYIETNKSEWTQD